MSSRKRLFILNDPSAPRLNPSLAQEIGLNESIILLQIEFWISISNHFINGKYWTYQSLTNLKESFPFWSKATINRAIKNLIDDQYIIEDKFNQKKYDKTRWFTLNHNKLSGLYSLEIGGDETGSAQNETCLTQNETGSTQNDTTIPETTTEITTETTTKNIIYEQIKNLRLRYSENQLKVIDDYLDILKWTRKHGKIADSVILSMYNEWSSFKIEFVMYGLSIYINNPKHHDKRENYTIGIMKNATAEQVVQHFENDGKTKQNHDTNKAKNRFHNFKQRKIQYTSEELKDKLNFKKQSFRRTE
ncbi:MAG: hypothetical protein MJA82_10895 [Clostridia bacterium]|nr:hypothetical protein [Clostridia bacterium]